MREESGLENLENALKIFTYYRDEGLLESMMRVILGTEISSNSEMDKTLKEIAYEKEKLLDFKGAIEIFEKLKMYEDSKRVRKKMQDGGSVKVDQTVVHGDYIDDRDTIVKDSVINHSNVGGGTSKMQELEKLAEMKDKGIIDDDEFKQMKKEILGK